MLREDDAASVSEDSQANEVCHTESSKRIAVTSEVVKTAATYLVKHLLRQSWKGRECHEFLLAPFQLPTSRLCGAQVAPLQSPILRTTSYVSTFLASLMQLLVAIVGQVLDAGALPQAFCRVRRR